MYSRTTVISVFVLSAASALGMNSSRPFINADDVFAQGISGNGVTVAVIDYGVDYNEHGLAGSIAAGGVTILNGTEYQDGGQAFPEDTHGTYMSLIIADNNMGVAPYSRILPIRAFAPSDWILGIDYVRRRRASDPSVRVINMSLGWDDGVNWYPCPCDQWEPEAQQAISNALAAGIVTFVATGNEVQCGETSPPACVSSAVKVTASYDADYPTINFGACGDVSPPAYWIVCFSNRAADCDFLLAAPGYDISVGGFSSHGTSQATAHCSGVAALMFDKSGPCGGLNGYTARSTIYNTATINDFAFARCPLPPQPRHLNALTAVNAVTAGTCSPVVGDLNCDDTLDASDLDGFSVCMTGPLTDPLGGGCTCADFPASPPDGDVDLHDFIRFQRLFGGGGSTSATVALDVTSPNAGQTVEPGGMVDWTVTATVSQSDNAGLAAVSVDLVQSIGNGRLVDITPATSPGTGMDGFVRPAGISNPETGVAGSGYGGTPVARNLRQIGGAQNTLGEAGDTGTGEDFTVDPAVGQAGPQVIAQGSFTAPLAAGTYVFRIENGLANVLDVVSPPPSPPAVWPVSAANVILNSSSFSVVVPYDLAVPDFDRDGDVDQNDFALMQACYTSDTATVVQLFPDGSCDDFDLDGDGYVNARDPQNPSDLMGDLDWFEKCAGGPGIPADSECCDCDGHGILDARVNPPDPWVNNFDYDGDGVQVLGRPNCLNGNSGSCDDNCPCLSNADQADNNGWADGDGVGDACEPPPPITITAWRSVRQHGTAGALGIELDPAADGGAATVEPRQGNTQIIEVILSRSASPSSNLWGAWVFDDQGFPVYFADISFSDSSNQTVVLTFIDDPMITDDFLLDQRCYLIDLSEAIADADGRPLTGDADCIIRMLAGDVDGDALVEEVDDEGAIAAANGQAANASNMRLDIDTDGTITGTEMGPDRVIAHALLGHTAACGEGMLGMSGATMALAGEGTGPASGADALVGTSVSAANVTARWVIHGTGETSVKLPRKGGTVVVDLVVSTDAPIWGFEARPAVNAAGVVSIDAANWTERDNVLFSSGLLGHTLASAYDLTVMDWLWVRLTPDGSDITDFGTDVNALLEPNPPVVWTLTNSLAELSGPISTPAGDGFVTSGNIGGVTKELLPVGQTTLATLSLTIAGVPGTYHLALSDGFFLDEALVSVSMSSGTSLEIVVRGQ